MLSMMSKQNRGSNVVSLSDIDKELYDTGSETFLDQSNQKLNDKKSSSSTTKVLAETKFNTNIAGYVQIIKNSINEFNAKLNLANSNYSLLHKKMEKALADIRKSFIKYSHEVYAKRLCELSDDFKQISFDWEGLLSELDDLVIKHGGNKYFQLALDDVKAFLLNIDCRYVHHLLAGSKRCLLQSDDDENMWQNIRLFMISVYEAMMEQQKGMSFNDDNESVAIFPVKLLFAQLINQCKIKEARDEREQNLLFINDKNLTLEMIEEKMNSFVESGQKSTHSKCVIDILMLVKLSEYLQMLNLDNDTDGIANQPI